MLTWLLVGLLFALSLIHATTPWRNAGSAPELDVPYFPTPPALVEKMLDLAHVGPHDVVYDLGCGDGRIVIAAAQHRGARGVGIDLNPERIRQARHNAVKAGVEQRVRFEVGDLFEADFQDATVVTLYLLPDLNRQLRPELWKLLKVGARVVSHNFDMGPEWPPEKIETLAGQTIYRWTITQANKDALL